MKHKIFFLFYMLGTAMALSQHDEVMQILQNQTKWFAPNDLNKEQAMENLMLNIFDFQIHKTLQEAFGSEYRMLTDGHEIYSNTVFKNFTEIADFFQRILDRNSSVFTSIKAKISDFFNIGREYKTISKIDAKQIKTLENLKQSCLQFDEFITEIKSLNPADAVANMDNISRRFFAEDNLTQDTPSYDRDFMVSVHEKRAKQQPTPQKEEMQKAHLKLDQVLNQKIQLEDERLAQERARLIQKKLSEKVQIQKEQAGLRQAGLRQAALRQAEPKQVELEQVELEQAELNQAWPKQDGLEQADLKQIQKGEDRKELADDMANNDYGDNKDKIEILDKDLQKTLKAIISNKSEKPRQGTLEKYIQVLSKSAKLLGQKMPPFDPFSIADMKNFAQNLVSLSQLNDYKQNALQKILDHNDAKALPPTYKKALLKSAKLLGEKLDSLEGKSVSDMKNLAHDFVKLIDSRSRKINIKSDN